jgi:hypothetical protein
MYWLIIHIYKLPIITSDQKTTTFLTLIITALGRIITV